MKNIFSITIYSNFFLTFYLYVEKSNYVTFLKKHLKNLSFFSKVFIVFLLNPRIYYSVIFDLFQLIKYFKMIRSKMLGEYGTIHSEEGLSVSNNFRNQSRLI